MPLPPCAPAPRWEQVGRRKSRRITGIGISELSTKTGLRYFCDAGFFVNLYVVRLFVLHLMDSTLALTGLSNYNQWEKNDGIVATGTKTVIHLGRAVSYSPLWF